jgi:Glyoxalase/Bleomycin resistance protein/Dioxygenase superfamily
MLLNLIPKVFYADIQTGLDFFQRGLGFELLHQDDAICVLGRDHAKVYLMQNAELAALDRPELSVDTDDIASMYAEIKARAPEFLHPNSATVQRKPWGSQEFALLDATTVCVVFRQWGQ